MAAWKRTSVLLALLLLLACRHAGNTEVAFHTSLGTIRVRLYDSTPRHRDNFLELATAGYYDSLAFHRVVRDVAVQGGDPATRRSAAPAKQPAHPPALPLEDGGPPLRGALCAARGPGPGQSDGAQFFFVPGSSFTENSLAQLEKRSGVVIPPASRRLYLERGGVPQLEGQVTVFGEVVGGIEVVDKIAALPHTGDQRPLREVRFTVEVIRP
jgi:cyclophilin family peptidyl-prolyl cis-trans isomerase